MAHSHRAMGKSFSRTNSALNFKRISYIAHGGGQESLKDQTGDGILVIKIDWI